MVTPIPYLHLLKPQLKTSVAELQWIKAEGVKSESPYTSILLRNPLQESLWLFSLGIDFRAPQKGSESVVIDIERLMEWLIQKVQLENPHNIREYLLQFTDLLDVIPQAVGATKKNFPEAQLVMDVYQDPEIADCYLVLYIRLKHYDDSVIERLEKAEAEFLDQLVNKEGWIQLTTDFREPEGKDVL